VKYDASSSASSQLPPDEWTLSAPSTRIRAGPSPTPSYAIVVPSCELTVFTDNGTFYGRAMKPGRIYAIAGNRNFGYSGDGGPAVKAEIEAGPLRIDQYGNVIFGRNPEIRVIADRTGTFYGVPMTAGDIYTIARGTQGTGSDGGPALDAQFELIKRSRARRHRRGTGLRPVPDPDDRHGQRHVLRRPDDRGRHLHRRRYREPRHGRQRYARAQRGHLA
jgi:hypothetical protein